MPGPHIQDDPDPHGYIAAGKEQASKYMMRQHWRMKWITLTLGGLLSSYTIITSHWIPMMSMNLVSWVLFMFASFMGMKTLNLLFAHRVKITRTGSQDIAKIDKSIFWYGIALWSISVILVYWLVVIGWLSWFAEIPNSP